MFIVKKVISAASILIKRDAIFKILRSNPLGNFWNLTQDPYNKTINNFNVTYIGGQVDINWGEESVNESIPSNTNINHTFGITTQGISILPKGANISSINCGTSSPRLGGAIDLSAFPDLQEFRCNSNGITELSNYAQNSNLTLVNFFDNAVTGSIPTLSGLTNLLDFNSFSNPLTGPIPSLNGLSNLVNFRCNINQLTGFIPSLSGLTALEIFSCQNQTGVIKLTGPIPSLNGLSNLQIFSCNQNQLTGLIPSLSGLNNFLDFDCSTNQLTGPIPSLNGLSNLVNFRCQSNQLTGLIPNLSGLNNLQIFGCQNQTGVIKLTGPIPSLNGLSNLLTFQCNQNQLTGLIPNLSGLNNLQTFFCGTNQLTGFVSGSISNTLGNFQAQNNQLRASAVNLILGSFVEAGRTTGTPVVNGTCILNLGGTNSRPINQGITDVTTLRSLGWTVTTGTTLL